MKTSGKQIKYNEWLSADELHNNSQTWLSKLRFAQGEQTFLNNLIKDYTLDLLDSKIFPEVKPSINSLQKMQHELAVLLKKIILHEKQLQIMVDDVDQLKMENAYLDTHVELTTDVNVYFKEYEGVKTKIFNIISSVIKKRKRKRLLSH